MSSIFTSQPDGQQQQQQQQTIPGTPHYQYDPSQYQHMSQPPVQPGYNMRPPGMHPNMPVPHPTQTPHQQHHQAPQQIPASQTSSHMVNHKMSAPIQSAINQPHSQPQLTSQMPPQMPPQLPPQIPSQMTPQIAAQMPPQMAPPASVQKLLDENNQFIQLLLDYQAKGKHQECAEYQKLLHRNLVYLATVADANNQSIQNSSSSGAPPNITLPSPNVNPPHNMNGHPS